ncbi:MAG: ACP S-malonyltransferase, partial [Dehalococcoidia bacterium]|nr:ACP S-malonyltransferase [Dehalococcoidia bacterium]
PVVDEFSEIISTFVLQPPTIPIIANVTTRILTDTDSIKEELLKQLRHCIQWQSSIEYMIHSGVTSFYEIGPGKVLCSLIKRTSAKIQVLNISGIEDIIQLRNSTITN